ncbi:MAG: hypothetical protein CME69_08560 [Halobacteriovorax sp.]|nr:hypothetical protein [Halobacteriovorax sp.]
MLKVKSVFFISLIPLLITSCGKKNTIEPENLYHEQSSFNEESVKNDSSNTSQNPDKEVDDSESSHLLIEPVIKIENIQAYSKHGKLHFSNDKQALKRIKKRFYLNNKIDNSILNFLSNKVSINTNTDAEIISHFKNLEETDLHLKFDINQTENILNIKDLEIKLILMEDNQLQVLKIYYAKRLGEFQGSIRLNTDILKKIYQNKAQIGFILGSYDAYHEGVLLESDELQKNNNLFIFDKDVKKISNLGKTNIEVLKKAGILVQAASDKVFMIDSTFNTTNTISRDFDHNDYEFNNGKWVLIGNAFIYVRNSIFKEQRNYFYKISTRTTTFTQEQQSITRQLTFLRERDLNITKIPSIMGLRNSFDKGNRNINGHDCDYLNSFYLCKKGARGYTITEEEKTCHFKKLINKRQLSHEYRNDVVQINNKDVTALSDNNSLYLKISEPLNFTKRNDKKVKTLKTGYIDQNCNYKHCKPGQGNCFIGNDYSLTQDKFTDHVDVIVKESI